MEEKPKKKRGRKPKITSKSLYQQVIEEHELLLKNQGQQELSTGAYAFGIMTSGGVNPTAPKSSQLDAHFIFQAKAGQEDVDHAKIAKVIKGTSKNSEYYKTEERRLMVVKEKVDKYKGKIERYRTNTESWALREFEVKRRIVAHSREIDISRTWIHVDMDMFYAAVSASISLNLF